MSLKLARTHFGNTKCTQADHMMQLKKQDQTDKPLNSIVLSHDRLDQILLYKNLKVKDIYSNTNEIRARQFMGVFLIKHNMK